MSKFSVGKLAHKAKHGIKHAGTRGETHCRQSHAHSQKDGRPRHARSSQVCEPSGGCRQQGADAARKGLDEMVDLGHITDEIKHDILKALESAEKTGGFGDRECREIGNL